MSDEASRRRSQEQPPSGFPEPPGGDPGDRSRDEDPHHSLNTPVGEPDPSEWPDPYERRADPRSPQDGDASPAPGATSTSEPHPTQDPEAEQPEAPERDKLDD
ncbi:MAG: hypothetical protein E6G56_01340 [Actinobacteria bacterium]|nr:MAG: hypothetical protein E6G56_01340 [Actinomycetota bacterium]